MQSVQNLHDFGSLFQFLFHLHLDKGKRLKGLLCQHCQKSQLSYWLVNDENWFDHLTRCTKFYNLIWWPLTVIDCLTGGFKKIKFKRLFNINREEYNIQIFCMLHKLCCSDTEVVTGNNRFSLNKSRFTSTWFQQILLQRTVTPGNLFKQRWSFLCNVNSPPGTKEWYYILRIIS